jgi:hypothetical protein
MHYQAEATLVCCTMGAIYDAAINLRPEAHTFSEHVGVILTVENRRMFSVSEDWAHGFLILQDYASRLYPLCWSITGDSVRQTLKHLNHEIDQGIHEAPSGPPVFDWTGATEMAYPRRLCGGHQDAAPIFGHPTSTS